MKWMWIVLVAACVGFPLFSAGPAAAQTRKGATKQPLKAEAFPTADDVERAYSNPAESLAALRILLDLLEFRAGTKTALAINRQNDYRRAITRLDPPRNPDLDREAAARKLKADPSFEFAIVARFLSADAPDAARKLAAANAATARQRISKFASLRATIRGATALGSLISPSALISLHLIWLPTWGSIVHGSST